MCLYFLPEAAGLGNHSLVVTGTEIQTTRSRHESMNNNYLCFTAAIGVKFSALVLLLLVAVGCNERQNNPEVDGASSISTTETTTSGTTDVDTTEVDTTTKQSELTVSSQTTPPQGEPGYVGYPYMGETSAGQPVYYIFSEAITCANGQSGCVSVSFVQVDADDAYQTAEGQAIAQCSLGTLTEVMLDGNLVAYEIASPDEAMAGLLKIACQEHRPE